MKISSDGKLLRFANTDKIVEMHEADQMAWENGFDHAGALAQAYEGMEFEVDDTTFKIKKENITLEAFEELCRKTIEKKRICDEIDESLKLHTKALEEMKAQVLAYFIQFDKDSHTIKGLGTLYQNTRFSVRVPVGDERKKFFGYLKERGIFDDMITVNSQTLNSWCKQEMENEIAKGNFDHKIPGLADAKSTSSINIRKA